MCPLIRGGAQKSQVSLMFASLKTFIVHAIKDARGNF